MNGQLSDNMSGGEGDDDSTSKQWQQLLLSSLSLCNLPFCIPISLTPNKTMTECDYSRKQNTVIINFMMIVHALLGTYDT